MKIDVRDRGWFLFIIILLSSNKLRDQDIVWFKPYLSRTCINPQVCFFTYIYMCVCVCVFIVKSIVIRLKHNSREYNFIVAYVGSAGNNMFFIFLVQSIRRCAYEICSVFYFQIEHMQWNLYLTVVCCTITVSYLNIIFNLWSSVYFNLWVRLLEYTAYLINDISILPGRVE